MHFPFGSFWQNFGQTEMYQQKPCRSCHFYQWPEITSVKSPLLQLFSKHFEHFIICAFSGCWAVWSSAKNQEGIVFHHCSRSTFDSCLCQGKLLAVCLQSCPQPIMCSADRYRSWFSQILCNPSTVGADQDWITFIPQKKGNRVCV